MVSIPSGLVTCLRKLLASSTVFLSMRLVLAFTLCLIAGAPLSARAAEPPVILIVGDSLSAGYGLMPGQSWVTLLQQRLKHQGYGYRVVNASVSGETTDGAVQRLDRALFQHHPAVVIIELGGNDGLRGLPVSRVRANLDLLIMKSRAAGAQVLLVAIRVPINYGQRYASSFQGIYNELATRYRIGVVPFLSDQVAVDLALFQEDGIHPNAQAQPLLMNNLWLQLSPLLRRNNE
jgi:acyl-CoA thioesterase-1